MVWVPLMGLGGPTIGGIASTAVEQSLSFKIHSGISPLETTKFSSYCSNEKVLIMVAFYFSF